jgi:hypothetical protein
MCLTTLYVEDKGYLCDRSVSNPGTNDCLCFVKGGRKVCLKDYMVENDYAMCKTAVKNNMVSNVVRGRQ